MAAITATPRGGFSPGGAIIQYYGTSASNQADTLSSTAVPAGAAQKLLYVTCKYDAAPTQAGVTVTLDSGISALYDTLLNTGTANAQNTAYIPDGDVWLTNGDAIIVAAPAGGAGAEASIVIALLQV